MPGGRFGSGSRRSPSSPKRARSRQALRAARPLGPPGPRTPCSPARSPPSSGHASLHALPHVDQQLVVSVETDEAQAGKLEVDDDVKGESHGEREAHDVDPAPPLTFRHAVSGEQRAYQYTHDEHRVDDY